MAEQSRRLGVTSRRRGSFGGATLTALLALGIVAGCGPSDEIRRWNQSGLEQYGLGDYYAAIGQFENARKLDPERPEASFYIGRCYMRLAEQKMREDNLVAGMRFCDRAASEFERSYRAFPGYSQALQGQREALKLRGRQQAAVDIAAWASAHATPRAKMLILESRELSQTGDLDRALRQLKTAVALEPDNAAAHAELGRFYLRCGNDREAVAALRRAYDLDPGAPGVVSALAQLDALPPQTERATSP